jgi:kynurenine formamidase
MHHHHKIILALIAAALVTSISLFWFNRTSIAPENGGSVTPAQPAQTGAPDTAINENKLVDLTYTFDEQTIYWPTAQPFKWEKESWGQSAGGYWYTVARYAASEHGGTHLDAPIHFGESKAAMDEIPLTRLVGPAVILDVRQACEKDADYRVTLNDVTAWEKDHGPIPAGAIVIAHTGWGRFWPDKKRYLGTDKPGDVANLHFPGFSREAAEFLANQRQIDAVGIDTPSIDYGQSKDFIVHQVLNGANIYGLENVAHLERVPPTGATILALPMKIKGGTGGPVRLLALLP